MDLERRRRWEERHRAADVTGRPSPFVVRALDRLATETLPPVPSRALDLACGRGRHALLLADRGYRVDAVDWALPALLRLADTAKATGRDVRCLVADLTTWPIPAGRYALVVAVDFLERPLFPALLAAVAPGGALLYETHLRDGHVPPAQRHRAEYLLTPGELDDVCRGWRILERSEETRMVDENPVARAGILAQRPSAAPH